MNDYNDYCDHTKWSEVNESKYVDRRGCQGEIE
jgi:hypothetical protein